MHDEFLAKKNRNTWHLLFTYWKKKLECNVCMQLNNEIILAHFPYKNLLHNLSLSTCSTSIPWVHLLITFSNIVHLSKSPILKKQHKTKYAPQFHGAMDVRKVFIVFTPTTALLTICALMVPWGRFQNSGTVFPESASVTRMAVKPIMASLQKADNM